MKITILLALVLLVHTKEGVSEGMVEYYLKLLQDFQNTSSQWKQPTDNREFFQPIDEDKEPVYYGHYHFIIVGAGVAGSVLANRLTESGKFKVLVLEAGGRENNFTDVPGFAHFLARSNFNWGYKTTQQRNCCLGMKNKQCNYPRGKAVGGSSVINFLMYIRGNREDFDQWGRENPEWDYESILPFFKTSENAALRLEDPGYHGHYGPLSVEDCKNYPNVTNVFLKTAEQRGEEILDYNGKNQNGYSTMQMNTKEGVRCSANKAFIQPAMNRRNLNILDYALGTIILIKNKTAYGVEFIRNKKKYRATASKEVIISGGVVNSPQILMVSGIGPKEHLEELGIPVVQDLPVGKTFHDHQMYPGLIFSTNLSANAPDMVQYVKNYLEGFGSLTSPLGLSGVGFGSPRVKSANPSVEYVFVSAVTEEAASFILDFMQIATDNWQALSNPVLGKYVCMIIPVLLHPKSKGTIKLKTKDPLDYPVLDSNLYSDEDGDDMKEMLAIIEDVFEISRVPAFQKIGLKYLSDPLPTCKNYRHLSSDYWRCALGLLTYPALHGVATCRMGPKDDKTAVIDNKLRIHGMNRLRVVDASAIPFSLSGHPTPAVYMVGEKGADLIRQQHGDL